MPDEQHPAAESQGAAAARPAGAPLATAPLATEPLATAPRPHEVADWRLRVFSLYERVRSAATPRDGHELWRRGRDDLFATHPASPLPPRARERFRGLPVAPYDPAYRFDVPLTPEGAGQERRVATGTDGVVVFVRLGTFELPGLGRIAAWEHAGYGGGIFVPFRDGTAGRPGPGGSYGAGRYLLDSIKGAFLGTRPDEAAGTRYVLDFNFAYNPSCAYDEAWACPLPGPENRLSVDVAAGELAPPGA
jgi:uncharacterized protein (DUF1684 family)